MLKFECKSQTKCIFTRGFPAGNPVGRLASHDTLYKRCKTFKTSIENSNYHIDFNYKSSFRTKESGD